jgi:hypothetical protein
MVEEYIARLPTIDEQRIKSMTYSSNEPAPEIDLGARALEAIHAKAAELRKAQPELTPEPLILPIAS